MKLSTHDIEVEYLKGKENIIADALSRVSPLKPKPDDITEYMAIPVHQITTQFPGDAAALQEFREATRKDEISMALTHAITNGWPRMQPSPV